MCLGSAEKNFEDWPLHPHNNEGFEFDESKTSGFLTQESVVSLWSPLVLVDDNPDYQEHSVALRVFHNDTYKVLKTFRYSRWRYTNLMANEYAVVQFQETWSRGQHGYYILI